MVVCRQMPAASSGRTGSGRSGWSCWDRTPGSHGGALAAGGAVGRRSRDHVGLAAAGASCSTARWLLSAPLQSHTGARPQGRATLCAAGWISARRSTTGHELK